MRSGIIAGGNWIRDHVKSVDAWPEQDGLANILGRTDSNGGGPYNLLKDLARLGAPFPLAGAGLVGDDADGHAILADCRLSEIDTTRLRPVPGAGTSYTDVISVRGRRTFFHERGANALLGPEHFEFGLATAKIFYLGYLLLLDRLDSPGPDGRPTAASVFQAARQAGLTTAADCVSAAPGAFGRVFPAVLAGIDVLFVNDFEAEQITGIGMGRGESLTPGKARDAARRLLGLGVRSWAIVHFPEGACACSSSGESIWQPAVRVPSDLVASAVGAGDAFAAGVLLGVHEDWPMARALELGVCAAAVSLLHPTCSGGVLPADESLAFGRRQGFLGPR